MTAPVSDSNRKLAGERRDVAVTAAILNYNLTEYTIDCVRSLLEVDYDNLHILIVDNGSPDQPAERLASLFPRAEVRSTGANLGYTGGINAAVRFALERKPEFILVLNPDTVVDPGFLRHLVAAMEANPRAAGACGTIYTYHDQTLVWYAGGRMIPIRGLAVHDRMNEHLDPSTLGPPRRVTFITGCLILHRASMVSAIGGEDERFFMALDDIELSARIQRKGFELLYVPKAIIYHKVFGEQDSAFKVYYSVRNRLLLIRLSWSGYVRYAASAYFLLVIGTKLVLWFFTNRPFFRAAQMGLTDYFRSNFGKARGVSAFRYREDLT